MVPTNLLAVLLCGLLSMVLGSLWYGPLFGKPWMKMMGFHQSDIDAAKKKGFVGSGMAKSYSLMLVGSLLTAFVLSHLITFAELYFAKPGVETGLLTAAGTWLGLIAPVTMGSVLWENKSWKLWLLNNGYQLCYLLIASVILVSWK